MELQEIDFNHANGRRNPIIRNSNNSKGELGYMYRWDLNSLRYNVRADPFQLITRAFERYIVGTNIQSNTIGINIIYIQSREHPYATRNIFIAKRSYNGTTTQNMLENTDQAQHVAVDQIQNSAVFDNNQINNVLDRLRDVYRIIQITVCEVYHDTAEAEYRRNNGGPRGGRGYIPFVIPIKLLYRNISNGMYRFEKRRHEAQTRIWDRMFEEEQRRREEEEDRLEEEEDTINLQQQMMNNLQNPSDEAQQQLLDNWNLNTEVPTIGDSTENPNQLVSINDQTLLNKPVSSYVFPGACQICLDDSREDLCRVNCSVGHIFHHECITRWRNSRKTNTYYNHMWNDDCPVCHEPIESMVQVPPAKAATLPSEFGKRKNKIQIQLKCVDAEIKYLSKKG